MLFKTSLHIQHSFKYVVLVYLVPKLTSQVSQLLTISVKSCNKRISMKTIYGEMLIKASRTTLLQIVCNIILSSKVILKCINSPDDYFCRCHLTIMLLIWPIQNDAKHLEMIETLAYGTHLRVPVLTQ